MEHLDLKYLTDLVTKAQQGSSNAFAELYTATYQRLYGYCCRMLQEMQPAEGDLREMHPAEETLRETYIRALRNIRSLQNPELYVIWLNQICFQTCCEILSNQQEPDTGDIAAYRTGRYGDETVEVEGRRYILRQLENLPLAEGQALLMKYHQKMKADEIADQLNVSSSTVKRWLKSGLQHLKKLEF